ncbi:hypothetical protein E2C01_083997 [Portunus trituberculatus]|uniref:Uncharacterized protein n=1 Tax=Portunus trituberculatus TaxID=210409 RepID=A0A5B7J332_PORTR|nr:hypothetical protein [Portunus trituberculatus]
MDVFNKVRRIAGKYPAPSSPLLLSAGQTVAYPKTVADLFAEHFASVSRKDPAAPGARHRQRIESFGVNFSSTGGDSYNVLFSVSELQTALSQCQDSSPGPDDIPYAFLRHMSDSAFNFLLNLYNMIWHFHSPSVDILPCPESPCTEFIGATAYRSHVPYK